MGVLDRLESVLWEAEKWMQKAVHPSKEGTLTALAKKEGGITKDGTISTDWLQKKTKTGGIKAKQRANFVLRARGK